jgi:hypothetical protein
MTQPDPLPQELPIGTEMSYAGENYISLTVGKLLKNGSGQYYWFDKVENKSSGAKTSGSFFPIRITWNKLPENYVENKSEEIVDISIIKCKWCNNQIDNGMLICSSEVSSCELYWNALKERCLLSYIEPEDALEYDRASVKNFVDNRKKK